MIIHNNIALKIPSLWTKIPLKYSILIRSNSTSLSSEEVLKLQPCIGIFGPSGVGKGTLINKLINDYPSIFQLSVSHTTRLPRKGEIDGYHYHFTNETEFKNNKDDFIEITKVHNNYYGTKFKTIENIWKKNKKIIIFDLDSNGIHNIKKNYPKLNIIFITLPEPIEENLKNRLLKRNSETLEQINIRLKNSSKEYEYMKNNINNINLILNNDNIDTSYQILVNHIKKSFPFFFP